MSDGSDRNDAVLVGRFRREFNAFWNRGDWHDDDRPNDEWDPIADAGISALRRGDLDGAVHAIVHYVSDEMELEVSSRTESELRRFLSDFARSAGWTSTHTPANSRSPLSEPTPADVEGERPGPAALWNMIDDFCESVRPSARVNETQLAPRLRAVQVVPNNQHAIPLSIVVGPDEVILGLGHDGCRFELSADDAPTRSKIREILEAARNGRAEEETWRRSSECRVWLADGTEVSTRTIHGLTLRSRRGPSTVRRYEPYDPSPMTS
ncbi:hypothetical protein [Georgenia daeguensis]|uniref:DUF222 domain-containing protein n=1 Tax=Georgenia daeguensis TaxID=908355 RepID=A0ABP8EY85_9MICO